VHTSTIHEKNSGTIRPGAQAPHTGPLAARGSLRYTVTMLAFALIAALSVKPLVAQVPAIVATSEATIASGFSAGPVVTDSCGDAYVYEGGGTGIVEIQASTGNVITVIKNAQGYTSGGQALYMDAAKKNLYFPDFGNFYTTHFDQVPIVNCLAGAINNTFAGNLYSLPNPNYYWGTAQDIAGDAAGDVFFTTTANVQSAIYEEIFNSSANTYTAAQILQSWPHNVIHIAADAAGDVFFNDGTTNIYELKAPYTTAPTVAAPFATGFNTIAGLSLDAQGNLYIADSGTSLVYEIPNEGGTLNPAHQYAVAAVGVVFKVGVDAFHNLYLSNYYPGAAEIKTGSAVAPATAVGKVSAAFPITYVFNTSVTPTGIMADSGTAASTTFSTGTGGCAVGTAYKALSSCSVNATYMPSAVGEQTGAITLSSTAGDVTTFVSGIGQGAAATIDPGTVSPSTTTLTAPTGVTVDNLGNIFVTDTKANTLTEFAAGGGGVGTTVSTGTLTLSAPQGVAVDAMGDIFIADTGNNRVVEIPVVNGVLANASTVALSPVLKKPEGVAVDGAGNLYLADTGDNNLLVVPNINGTLVFAAAQSYGTSLSAPSAVTVDPNGNVFLAEATDVLEFAEPIGSSPQVKVASGLSAPSSVATDASGSLFVVDSGSSSIFRYPNVGGNLGARILAGSTVANPTGVATDASGNLYVTDTTNDLTVQIKRVTAALNFGGWNVGTTSTPLTGTISSSGNESLVFQSPAYTASGNTAAGFSITSDTCAGQSELPGGSCSITATFTPPVPELNAEEDLTLTSNAANGSPVLQLIGTGAHITPSTLTIALTSPTGNPTLSAGEAVTFTATVGTGTGTASPGGSIKFFVNGTQVGTVPVTSSAASLTLQNGLPAGNGVIVSANYTGDVINYSGSTAQITENVIALADTVTLAISGPAIFNNPFSANDNAANANGPAVTLTATIIPSTTTIPGGTVTFYAGTTAIGIITVKPDHTAVLNTTALRAGTTTLVENDSFETTYNISAVYSGDTSYYGGTSNTLAIAIVGANLAATPANTTGATFTITPANPTITATTTTAGGPASGSTTLSINSYGGWNGVVNFTCSGLPAYATCNPFPGYPTGVPSTPGANVLPTTVDFIINTNVTPIVPTGSSMTWWISGIAGFLLLVLRRRVKQSGYLRAGQLLTVLAAVLFLTGSAIGISGCSSSTYPFVTPAGSSTVTVKVSAAQLVPGTTTGNTELPDSNVPSFQITLIVK
jgi:hypothetical protein